MEKVEIFDSTLRDGAQGEGISFSLEDKLNIVRALDRLGVDYAEAGNPASNPRDLEFFARAAKLELMHCKLVAFGSTRRKQTRAEEDAGCASLLSAGTEVVSIFGKSWQMHVTQILRTTLEENLSMIADTVRFLKGHGKRVIFDAEHFFDGYKENPEYALQTLRTAAEAGAECIVLCDTNGGCDPYEISRMVRAAKDVAPVRIGIHCHNDIGCAVANSLEAVRAGARQVQGTYIGFGERCGNANLSTIIPALQLKLGYESIAPDRMQYLTQTARYIAEIANIVLPSTLPFVGKSAFAHKGGMHVDGVFKDPRSFEHVSPAMVGNERQVLLSDLAGRSALLAKIAQIEPAATKESEETRELIEILKTKEFEGYQYESAGASFEILLLKFFHKYKPRFKLENFKIIGEQPAANTDRSASAMVKVSVGEKTEITAAEGDGPVHALDKALRKALEVFYPKLREVRLIDYKVRVMDSSFATASKVRVIIESTDGERIWTTIGVSTDIIDASFQALNDSIEYKLLQEQS